MNNTTTTDDRIITLIRGLPGSGKSTLARSSIFNGALLFEADMFHIRGGNYYFDSDRAADAHAWCLNQFTRAVVEATSDVIVANTFRKISDIIPYLNVAKANNIKIRIFQRTGNHKSIHNVPDDVIETMKAEFEEFTSETLSEFNIELIIVDDVALNAMGISNK